MYALLYGMVVEVALCPCVCLFCFPVRSRKPTLLTHCSPVQISKNKTKLRTLYRLRMRQPDLAFYATGIAEVNSPLAPLAGRRFVLYQFLSNFFTDLDSVHTCHVQQIRQKPTSLAQDSGIFIRQKSNNLKFLHANRAQLVECWTSSPEVVGSSHTTFRYVL